MLGGDEDIHGLDGRGGDLLGPEWQNLAINVLFPQIFQNLTHPLPQNFSPAHLWVKISQLWGEAGGRGIR